MGIIDDQKGLIEFTEEHLLDKELVIQMLTYEEKLTKSDYGQDLYRNPLNKPFVSLTIEKALNRKVLIHFGFSPSDASVEMYRSIFRTYFNSPTDYDKDVISSVHYMRENKCVFYETPDLHLGDSIPDCPLYTLDGIPTTLFNVLALLVYNCFRL